MKVAIRGTSPLARLVPRSLDGITSKVISAPTERPIQFRCADFVVSDQSIQSRLSSSRRAYFVIWKNHCSRKRCSTIVPHRSHAPAMTCSFASTVLSFGHQLTAAFFLYASPRLRSCRKIHWVHL